jgi:hypothetical protein
LLHADEHVARQQPICDLRQIAGICDGQTLQDAHALLFPDVGEVI